MIALFCDFGLAGPYLGQVKAVLAREAPGVPVIDLVSDAPMFDIEASASLLAACGRGFLAGDVFWCVVDPGVGTAQREPVVIEADGRWFVGPDNGLFAGVAARADDLRLWQITWRPQALSASFHGRDLFAPVAARLARGEDPAGVPLDPDRLARDRWSDALARIIYVDGYGNLMTGIWAHTLNHEARIIAAGRELEHAHTFGAVPPGAAFWYENANALVELAVNQGSATTTLGLGVGDPITVRA